MGCRSAFVKLSALTGLTRAQVIARAGQPVSRKAIGDGLEVWDWVDGDWNIGLVFKDGVCQGIDHEFSPSGLPRYEAPKEPGRVSQLVASVLVFTALVVGIGVFVVAGRGHHRRRHHGLARAPDRPVMRTHHLGSCFGGNPNTSGEPRGSPGITEV